MERTFDLRSTLDHEDARRALSSGKWKFNGSNMLLRELYGLKKGAFVAHPLITHAGIKNGALCLVGEDGKQFKFSLMEWKFDQPDKDTITLGRKIMVKEQRPRKDGGDVVSVEIIGTVATFKKQKQ